MSLSATIPQMRPISDLRTHLNDIETYTRETGEPVVLTRNGTAALIVMDSNAYNENIARQRHIAKLREAEIEARYRSQTLSLEESKQHMAELAATVGLANA